MILFVSQYRFPEGDAGSERTLYLAQAYQRLGYKVLVVANGTKARSGNHKGVPYLSLRFFPNKVISRLLWFSRMKKQIKEKEKTGIDAIIASNLDGKSLSFLKKRSLRRNTVFIYDAVEWYDSRQFSLGENALEYKWNNDLITKFIDNNVRVIAISTFLNDFFLSKGIRSVNVPVIFNQQDMPFLAKHPSSGLTLQYAGSPGKKDSLDVILYGLNLLSDEELSKIRFNVIGVTEPQARDLFDNIVMFERLRPSLRFFGRKPMSFVRTMMETADFNILLRNNDYRNVKAGFSTKVVEGVSYSTPFIMNLTSDLGKYFKDGVDCIEVKEFSPESLKDAIQRALSLTEEERYNISLASKNTAVKCFNIDSYKERLLDIIKIYN